MKQNKIYVACLPFNTDEQLIQNEFSSFGPIDKIDLIHDRFSGEFKGFGFITFKTQHGAESSLGMNGKYIGGKKLKVCMAQKSYKFSHRKRRR